jgi:transcriptional regulator with XRE-family HTH domain
MQLTFNADALCSAATAAGDTKASGTLSYTRIGKRTGIDIAVVSRVHRGINAPDLRTVIGLARAYNLSVEDLISVQPEQPLAA